MPGALQHLLVLDLTSHLSGPYCAMLLADHGAEVIKVEPPSGDSARAMPPFVNGESAPFMTWNRNKRSVVLDLKQPADHAALLDLIDRADVLVENYRPGVLARLGLGWDVLHKRNPRLVLASISGFGQTGPYSSRGGFDLITQAMSGLMSTNGPADGDPFRLPIAISDVTAGMFLAFGVLAAIEARHRTGKGQHVETSLLEAATSLAVYEFGALLRHRHAAGADRSGASRQFPISVLRDGGRTHHGRCVTGTFLREVLSDRWAAGPGRRSAVPHQRRPGGEQRSADYAAGGEVAVATIRALVGGAGSGGHSGRPGHALR